jgi:PAS domain S-box-containing protein
MERKRYFSDSYETEIKISLILLIAFLISLNFISSYSLGKARIAQHRGFISRMELTLEFIQKSVELNFMRLPDAGYINDISLLAGIDRIEINDSLGNELLVVNNIPAQVKEKRNSMVKTTTVRNKYGYIIYYIIVSGVNREGADLQQLAFFDTVFRVLGLFAGLIVAFLFIRSVMNPYRKIKKEASHLNLPQVDFDDVDGVEYAVRTFQEVIRELKEKEALLQAMYDNSEKRADSLARYNEYILGSISSGVIICDIQGIITRFNRSAERIMGYDHRHAQGRHFNEVFGKKHHISKILSEALRYDKTYSRMEFEISRKDKEKLWLGLTSSLILDNDNNKIGTAVLLTDLTRIKKLQEFSDFTEKMAALGEMTAGLAHELRNSVAAIMGFGKLLRKISPPGERASAIADMIISESIATEEMLSRFLNFAKPLKVVPKKVNVSQLLKECLNLAADKHQGKKLEVKIEDNTSGILINADPVLLKNAFSNLIINALQAMAETGDLTITINYNENEKRVEVKVSDTGKGIAEENLHKVFNPFYTTRDKGIGLGLALVRKIINGHMGIIEVESHLGEGTTFTVSLPVEAIFKLNDDSADEIPKGDDIRIMADVSPETFE